MSCVIEIPGDRGKKYEMFRYPMGETQVRLTDEQRMHLFPWVYIKANIKDGEVMELALLNDAIHESNEWKDCKVVLWLPYLPYARADRRFTPGDCNALRVFGRLIDSMGFYAVRTIDVHSQAAFGQIGHLVSTPADSYIDAAIEAIGRDDLTILLPDEGAARYKAVLGAPTAQCRKKRDAATGKLTGFDVPAIPTRKALIVDDICDGGGTFLGIAEQVPASVELYLYVTHGIFSKGFKALFSKFNWIYTTDTINRPGQNGVTVFKVQW